MFGCLLSKPEGRRHAVGRLLLVVAICFGTLVPFASDAHHLVERHKLACGDRISCAKSLQRRVDFWIHVFREWDTGQVVLHDANVPHRVYRVMRTKGTCRRRNASASIERARGEIKKELVSLANKLKRGNRSFSDNEQHLIGMFGENGESALRRAAKNIRCQQGNKDRFLNALKRFGRYEALVVRQLKASGLPEDIKYLPFVESAYNPDAYSRVGAAGLWQIMPRTARVLGLHLTATVDERLDPLVATKGAMRYLQGAYKRLSREARAQDPKVTDGDIYPFVITSYNYGVTGMSRAIKQKGPNFPRVLAEYKSRSFRTAVRNFYASFLAARHVAKNADRYFGAIKRYPPLHYDTVVLKHPTSLARIEKVFGVSSDELKPFNGALTRYVWHGWRFIPKGYRLKLPPRKDDWQRQVAALEDLRPEDTSREGTRYKVKRGDTACGIAHAFQVRCRDLIASNGLNRRGLIRVGQNLVIPGQRAASKAIAKRDSGGGAKAIPASYTVKRGDTPCAIAKRYRLNCRELMRRNNIGKRGLIRTGQRLALVDKPRPERTASAGDADAAGGVVVVRRGDTVCKIAAKAGVNCNALLSANRLRRSSVIRPGQKLKLPGTAGVQVATANPAAAPIAKPSIPAAKKVMVAATAIQLGGTAPEVVSAVTPGDKLTAALDNDVDLRVRQRTFQGKTQFYLIVQPEETLGHYADWLQIGFATKLRRLNNVPRGRSITIGRRILLPLDTIEQANAFEAKRQEYHRVLVEEFKEHFAVTALDEYVVRRGDSVWQISNTHELPMWVVTRYNPQLHTAPPSVGVTLSIPRIRARDADTEPPAAGEVEQAPS